MKKKLAIKPSARGSSNAMASTVASGVSAV